MATGEDTAGDAAAGMGAELAALWDQVVSLRRQAKLLDAIPLAEHYCALASQTVGPESEQVAAGLGLLGELYYLSGRYAEAKPMYLQALEIRRAVSGNEHPDCAGLLNSLGLLSQELKEYAEAESFFLQSLDVREQVVGTAHPDFALTQSNLAALRQEMAEEPVAPAAPAPAPPPAPTRAPTTPPSPSDPARKNATVPLKIQRPPGRVVAGMAQDAISSVSIPPPAPTPAPAASPPPSDPARKNATVPLKVQRPPEKTVTGADGPSAPPAAPPEAPPSPPSKSATMPLKVMRRPGRELGEEGPATMARDEAEAAAGVVPPPAQPPVQPPVSPDGPPPKKTMTMPLKVRPRRGRRLEDPGGLKARHEELKVEDLIAELSATLEEKKDKAAGSEASKRATVQLQVESRTERDPDDLAEDLVPPPPTVPDDLKVTSSLKIRPELGQAPPRPKAQKPDAAGEAEETPPTPARPTAPHLALAKRKEAEAPTEPETPPVAEPVSPSAGEEPSAPVEATQPDAPKLRDPRQEPAPVAEPAVPEAEAAIEEPTAERAAPASVPVAPPAPVTLPESPGLPVDVLPANAVQPAVDFPAQVPCQDWQPLSVSVDLPAGAAGAEAETVAIDVIVAAPGYEFEGARTGHLDVAAGAEGEGLIFELCGLEPGDCPIAVKFWKDKRYVGQVRLNVEVLAEGQEGGEERAGATGEVDLMSTGAAPELTVNVDRLLAPDGAAELQFTLVSPIQDLDLKDVGSVVLLEGAGQFIERLLTQAGDAADAAEVARRFGRGLYQELLPPPLQELYWDFQEAVETLAIVSEETCVPWELVRPVRDETAGGDDEGPYWCESFAVCRWFAGPPPSPTLAAGRARVLCVAGEGGASAAATDAAQQILGEFGEQDVAAELLDGTGADLAGAFADAEADILHILCAEPGGESRFSLADAEVGPAELGELIRLRAVARPTVFLAQSASESGLPAPALIAPWAQHCLYSGCGAFVGSLWPVDSAHCAEFTRAFYRGLCGGAPIAQAFREARSAVRALDETAALAFSLYADPAASISSAGVPRLGAVAEVMVGELRAGKMGSTEMSLTNDGNGPLVCELSSDDPWLRLSGSAITVGPGETVKAQAVVDLRKVKAGDLAGAILVSSNGGSTTVPVSVQVARGKRPWLVLLPVILIALAAGTGGGLFMFKEKLAAMGFADQLAMIGIRVETDAADSDGAAAPEPSVAPDADGDDAGGEALGAAVPDDAGAEDAAAVPDDAGAEDTTAAPDDAPGADAAGQAPPTPAADGQGDMMGALLGGANTPEEAEVEPDTAASPPDDDVDAGTAEQKPDNQADETAGTEDVTPAELDADVTAAADDAAVATEPEADPDVPVEPLSDEEISARVAARRAELAEQYPFDLKQAARETFPAKDRIEAGLDAALKRIVDKAFPAEERERLLRKARLLFPHVEIGAIISLTIGGRKMSGLVSDVDATRAVIGDVDVPREKIPEELLDRDACDRKRTAYVTERFDGPKGELESSFEAKRPGYLAKTLRKNGYVDWDGEWITAKAAQERVIALLAELETKLRGGAPQAQ